MFFSYGDYLSFMVASKPEVLGFEKNIYIASLAESLLIFLEGEDVVTPIYVGTTPHPGFQ